MAKPSGSWQHPPMMADSLQPYQVSTDGSLRMKAHGT